MYVIKREERKPMKITNRIYTIGNRTFECYASPEGSAMVSVTIWEVVRPTWKIFRTRFYDSKCFWIDDYDSIEMGILASLQYFLDKEHEQNLRANKWKAFEGR